MTYIRGGSRACCDQRSPSTRRTILRIYSEMLPAHLGTLLLLAATTVQGVYPPYGPTEPSSYSPPQHIAPQATQNNGPQPNAGQQKQVTTTSFTASRDFVPVTIPLDLTHPLDSDAQAWYNTTAFIHENQRADWSRGFFYASNDIRLGEHVGTHMDAPYHFYDKGLKIGNISVKKLIAKAIILDGETRRNATVGVEHLKEWRSKHGPLPNPCVVLIRFNWGQFYSQREQYFAYSNGLAYEFEFPGITPALAEYLANLEEVVGVGIDTPSIDPGFSKDFLAHRKLAAANKYILENVFILPRLPPKGWTILAMPIRLTYGTGAPCRVVAIPSGYSSGSVVSGTVSVVIVTAMSVLGRVMIT